MPSNEFNPFPGLAEWIGKINTILDFWADPCDAPLTVWVQTVTPAALEMLANYFAFDQNEIVIQKFKSSFRYARPKSTRKGRGGSKSNKPKWRKRLGELINFDGNELSGKKLWGWQKLPAKKLTWRATTLFIVEGVAERVSYWLWVADLVTEFLYAWAGLMMKTEYCQALQDAVLLAHGIDQPITGLFGWVGLVMPDIDKIRGPVTWNVSTGSNNFNIGQGIVSAGLYTGSSFAATDIGLRVTVHKGGYLNRVYESSTSLGKDAEGEISIAFQVPPGWQFTVEHSVGSGLVTFTEPTIEFHSKHTPPKDGGGAGSGT